MSLKMATDADIQTLIDKGLSQREITRQLNCHRRRVKRLLEQDEVESLGNVAAGVIEAPEARRKRFSGKRYIFTSAQNNTHVHPQFLANLELFCKHRDAELVVSTFVYNKNGFQNGTKDDADIYYDPKLVKYFCDEAVQVADGLIFCGELNILPTQDGIDEKLQIYGGTESIIIPCAKNDMESVATMKSRPPKFCYMTGTVTQRNYIQKKAGQVAEFFHIFGALYVEIDDNGNWYARQLVADDKGVFHDLDERFDGKVTNEPVEAITWGDIHAGRLDANAEPILQDMLNTLQPRYQFVHDVLDFYSRNHHGIKDKWYLAEQHFLGRERVTDELEVVAGFLRRINRKGTETVIIESNHDLALRRWLTEGKTDFDPINGEFYHAANARMYKAIRERDKSFQVFKWALENYTAIPECTFLQEDDSFVIAGDVECALHGHLGANGARGTPRGLRKIGVKLNTGHTHSTGIRRGVYTAGVTASMDLGYNKGASSWSHSHIVTYTNGKRAIVTVSGDKWREQELQVELDQPIKVGSFNIYGIEIEGDLEL